MVRTKADRVPLKAVGGKAPQKTAKSTPVKKTVASKQSSSKGRNYSGGNPSHPRDTPEWQKPITCFLNQSCLKNSGSSEVQETSGEGSSREAENCSD